MVYKKYIKRGNKVYGPYAYSSKKSKGKVITDYMGKYESGLDFYKFLYVFTIVFLFFSLGVIAMGNFFQEEKDLNPFLRNLVGPFFLTMPSDINGIYIDPDSLTADLGEEIILNITGQAPATASDVYAIQFDIVYDINNLTLNSIDQGTMLNFDGASTVFDYTLTSGRIDNVFISRNNTLTGIYSDKDVFAFLNFTATGAGVSNVIIENVVWVNSTITNDSAETINPTIIGGSVIINSGSLVCTDADIDGYGVCPNCGIANGCDNDGDDCDDSNPNVYPGAIEACNGIDDNCDDLIDENNGDCSGAIPYCESGICVECLNALHCDDNIGCTVDSCNSGSCVNTPDDGLCDDGFACSVDFCNVGAGICDVDMSLCECPNGLASECDNSQYCDGTEICNTGTLMCESGTPPNCDDLVGCTIDSCNELTDSCNNIPDNSACDNGLFCDGTEVCDEFLDCQAGVSVICDDSDEFTLDFCNEVIDSCEFIPIDSDNDGVDVYSDCDDSNPNVYPGAIEACADGLDNDCDDLIDEEDSDCFGEDVQAPMFSNLQNFTHLVNTPFSKGIIATDQTGIDSYWLNDISVFNIDNSGLITNITALDTYATYWLTLFVNDTLGYENSGEFYIEITSDIFPPLVSVLSPGAGQSFNSENVNFEVVTDEDAVCNYTLDNGQVNYTMFADENNKRFTSSQSLSNGDYGAVFYCWDVFNNLNDSENVLFNVNVGSPIAPSGGNTGGGTSTVKKFSIDKDSFSITLEPGESTGKSFVVTNDGTVSLNFEISSEVEKLVQVVKKEFILAKGASQSVWFNIITDENAFPDIYVVPINIQASGITKEVLVSIEVVSKGSLFDIVLEIPEEDLIILPGEEMELGLDLTRLVGEEGEVNINYIIKDEIGNQVFYKKEGKVVGTSLSFVEPLTIPENLAFGKHVLYVQVEYQDKIASASTWFEVGKETKVLGIMNWLKSKIWKLVIWLSLITIIFVVFLIYLKKRQETSNIEKGLSSSTIRNKFDRNY